MLLKEKVCIVVGAVAPKSIGRATARLFQENGAQIVIADINVVDGTEADFVAETGCNPEAVCAIRCDVSDADACDTLVAQTIARFGRLDALINSAGIVGSVTMLDIDAQNLDRMIDVNLKGAFHLCQAALRVFEPQGHGAIVNIASVAAQRGGGLVGGAHYAAAKGGVVSLTRSIAREFGPRGIRANTVCPAMTQTSMLDSLSSDQLATIVRDIPLRRLGTPRDVAGACLFLASDLGHFVTGATIDVNGGFHIH